MGEPEPLRKSLDAQWTISSAALSAQSRQFDTFARALNRPWEIDDIPNIDDRAWKALICTLLGGTVDQAFDLMRSQGLESGETAYLLAIFNAPVEKRWALLEPIGDIVWNRGRRYESIGFWKLVESATPAPSTDTWQEPRTLLDARLQWALRNDGWTLQQWCNFQGIGAIQDPTRATTDNERYPAVRMLADDLDVLAEKAWSYLAIEAQRALLIAIPERKATSLWWERRRILEGRQRIEFARKQGGREDLLEAASAWIAEGRDAVSRLQRWHELDARERPSCEFIKDDVKHLFKELRKRQPPRSELSEAEQVERKRREDTIFALCVDLVTNAESWRKVLEHSDMRQFVILLLPRILLDVIVEEIARTSLPGQSENRVFARVQLEKLPGYLAPELKDRACAASFNDMIQHLADRVVIDVTRGFPAIDATTYDADLKSLLGKIASSVKEL